MQTKSYISAAALAAALLVTPQAALAQVLGLDVDLDVLGIEADADVGVGGESLLDADVDVGTAGSGSDTGASTTTDTGSDGSLVDIDIGRGGSAIGPNGGTLIDLNVGSTDETLLDADVDVLGTTSSDSGSSLVTGDIRLAALDQDARKEALLGLIDDPKLADLDLDALIDDRRVAIVAAADLLDRDALADIRAAVTLGGDGRDHLLDALAASVEMGAILDANGLDASDVVAVQIADNGATELIVLDGAVELALLGDNGDVAELTGGELANLDVDLLSREELAEIDLDLLPDDLRTTAQLRLLGSDSDDAELTPGELAAVDLDLLSQDELAELDLALLPDPLAAAVNLRLLADDGDLTDATVGDLAAIDISLLPGDDGGAGTGNSGNGEDGSGTAAPTPAPAPAPAPSPSPAPATGGNAGDSGGSDDSDSGSDAGTGGAFPGAAGNSAAAGSNGANITPPVGGTLQTQVDARFGIAALDCDIGVLALASGLEATPQAIASADALELVRIDGCQRSLVDGEVASVRAAIAGNPAIADVLDAAQIPLDEVIGATIQGGTLTLFIEPTVS